MVLTEREAEEVHRFDWTLGGKYPAGMKTPADFGGQENYDGATKEIFAAFEAWWERPEVRVDWERRMAELDHVYAPLLKALEDSERLTAKDYAIVINTRG